MEKTRASMLLMIVSLALVNAVLVYELWHHNANCLYAAVAR